LIGKPPGLVSEDPNVGGRDRLAGEQLRRQDQDPHQRGLGRHVAFEHEGINGVVVDVATQDAPDGDILAADRSNRVVELLFGDCGSRAS